MYVYYIPIIIQFCKDNRSINQCLDFFYHSEHYFDITIGFFGPANIGLAYLFMLVSWLEAEISRNTYFISAILKIQNGGHSGVCANANIRIPKMYRFATFQKFWTKIRSESDYYCVLRNVCFAAMASIFIQDWPLVRDCRAQSTVRYSSMYWCWWSVCAGAIRFICSLWHGRPPHSSAAPGARIRPNWFVYFVSSADSVWRTTGVGRWTDPILVLHGWLATAYWGPWSLPSSVCRWHPSLRALSFIHSFIVFIRHPTERRWNYNTCII